MKHDQVSNTAPKSVDRKRVQLDGVSRSYDSRVRAIRPDLADVALADLYFAPHYVAPVQRMCIAPSVMLRGTPDPGAGAISELLQGEAFYILDARGGWAWGYCGHDHYVGYVPVDTLGDPIEISHVTIAAAPLFSAASIKSSIVQLLPTGAKLSGTAEGDFLATTNGFVHLRHVQPIATSAADWVAVAEQQIGQPYVWGGRGGLGYDCSGLVQTALAACGHAAPRDTDQQLEALGQPIDDAAPLQRGDILFFPGHVGMMVDAEHLIHANAYWMATRIEPLADVVARLKDVHDQPITGRRRLAQ